MLWFEKACPNHKRIAMSDERPAYTKQEPYGPPICQAADRGDLSEMKATADAARAALQGVSFQPVSDDNREDVEKALAELEEKIKQLEAQ